MRVLHARFPEHLETIRELFREYAASIHFDLGFQDFTGELERLPGDYQGPRGALLLAVAEPDDPVGCVALRGLDQDTCEMKRLYVRPAWRHVRAGRALAEAVIVIARELRYRRMRLDTVPEMESAIRLYRALGFREIPPYRHNPIPGALYLELTL
ncbi:MAG: GNAT family N-acetyltransferase [Armatimonadetes bacterium]|nr:GNAT family N-acetyltransferase [Armatimonadota bacterium]